MFIRAILQFLLLSLLCSSPALLGQSSKFDDPPVPIKAVAPDYPVAMKRGGISGIVMVNVVIDENGEVTERAVSKSSRVEFEEPALAAVAKWKFKPARKAGAPVTVQITLPIKFAIEE